MGRESKRSIHLMLTSHVRVEEPSDIFIVPY